jgi:hypothetical protein
MYTADDTPARIGEKGKTPVQSANKRHGTESG